MLNLTVCILFIFLIYSFSLARPWQPFDERLFFEETLFPIPNKFNEIVEIIKNFVLNAHIESMNGLFSNHMTLRSDPIAWSFLVFIFYFFKKNAILYHIFQLTIHLTNASLIWFLFYKTIKLHFREINKKTYFLASIFTLLWALHSSNTEATLLVTNWNAQLAYTFCFCFLLYEISKISSSSFETTPLKNNLITFLFLLSMLCAEYNYTFPVIIFFFVFSFTYKQLGLVKKSFDISFKRSLPYFSGLVIFALFSFLKSDSTINNLFKSANTSFFHTSLLHAFIERNLWLSPQIFVHSLRSLFFPTTLSTYQSNLISLSNSLFDMHSIFCTTIYLSFLVIPLIMFFTLKSSNMSILLLTYCLYFSMFPFLHILAPTYCLAADRYSYLPSFFLLLIALNISSKAINNEVNSKRFYLILTALVVVLGLNTVKTLSRIYEWNEPYKLYKSAINVDKNLLYRGHKLIVLGDYIGAKGKQEEMEGYLQESLKELNKSLKQLKVLKKKYKKQPVTLKIYGLDIDSLILKAVYLISTVKHDNYQESAKNTLTFFEPYIKGRLNTSNINEITFYASLLLEDKQFEKTKEVLEYGYKKYPYSSAIIFSLIDYYLLKEKNIDSAYKLLQVAYKYFPNDSKTLYTLLNYYEQKNDLQNQARFAYLLGLRNHNVQAYQKALKIYLDLNQLKSAYKTLKKLASLNSDDPLSLLLASRYYDLTGQTGKILPTLTRAYFISKAMGKNQDLKIIKSILVSLINVNAHLGNLTESRKYLNEFEQLKDLSSEDRKVINLIKTNLKL